MLRRDICLKGQYKEIPLAFKQTKPGGLVILIYLEDGSTHKPCDWEFYNTNQHRAYQCSQYHLAVTAFQSLKTENVSINDLIIQIKSGF